MTTRRQHLAALGLGVAGLTLAGTSPAAAAPRIHQPLKLTARRTQITLPAVPSLGSPYIATLDLFDEAGADAGDAVASCAVVDLTLDGPVVAADVVLRLKGGEIHYQRVFNRFGPFPRKGTGAIVGGTGTYKTARGEVQVTWPDDDRIDLVIQPAG
ncbi:hypothetical protein [Amycolatopsis anabasis]|uniref:hypothetical protein n=1 Tax=Amycolatopsis anabasis TaxID=1840409 RepID=UPI00131E5003|nr:hypothetical protein [Amycolatopsis anabasis]